MGRGYFGTYTINDWMDDKKKLPLKGISLKNAMWGEDLLRAQKQLSRTSTVTYFCLTRLAETAYEQNNYRTMMKSSVNQQKLCYACARYLEQYEVDPKYDKAFERDIKKIFGRCDYIYRIVQENLKLTRYWPYFDAVGFERLLDFEQVYSEDESSVLDVVLPEIDRKKAFLAKKAAARKAEKEEEKQRVAYDKERKKKAAKWDREYDKLFK